MNHDETISTPTDGQQAGQPGVPRTRRVDRCTVHLDRNGQSVNLHEVVSPQTCFLCQTSLAVGALVTKGARHALHCETCRPWHGERSNRLDCKACRFEQHYDEEQARLQAGWYPDTCPTCGGEGTIYRRAGDPEDETQWILDVLELLARFRLAEDGEQLSRLERESSRHAAESALTWIREQRVDEQEEEMERYPGDPY
jgi:hypothetical protein